MNEQDIPLNWARRAGRPAKSKPMAVPVPTRIPRVTRLMALAIKFQDLVDRGEVRDYADLARHSPSRLISIDNGQTKAVTRSPGHSGVEYQLVFTFTRALLSTISGYRTS